MKTATQDPLVTRRTEELITVAFRTTRERRDVIRKTAKAVGLDSPSSLIRVAVDEYLARVKR